MIDSALEREAGLRLRHLVEHDAALGAEIAEILSLGDAVVFGGWVRDTLHSILYGEDLKSRDFDLVAECVGPRQRDAEQNHFGGHRFRLSDGLSVDCWQLSRTYAFTRKLMDASFFNLLHSTVYRLNGCTIDLRSYALAGEAAIEDIRNRQIGFNCTGYLDRYPEYQAFRAIDLRERLEYTLEEDVARFVEKTLTTAGFEHFAREVSEHRRSESPERLQRLFEQYRG